MASRREMNRRYAQAVICELQRLGYSGEHATDVFFVITVI